MPTFREDLHLGHKVPLVETDDLADEAITTSKIADEAITADKIEDGTITSDKIGTSEVKTANIDDEAVTANELANNAVTTEKVHNEAITTSKIADEAITADKLTQELQTIILGGREVIEDEPEAVLPGFSVNGLYILEGEFTDGSDTIINPLIQISSNEIFAVDVEGESMNVGCYWRYDSTTGDVVESDISSNEGLNAIITDAAVEIVGGGRTAVHDSTESYEEIEGLNGSINESTDHNLSLIQNKFIYVSERMNEANFVLEDDANGAEYCVVFSTTTLFDVDFTFSDGTSSITITLPNSFSFSGGYRYMLTINHIGTLYLATVVTY